MGDQPKPIGLYGGGADGSLLLFASLSGASFRQITSIGGRSCLNNQATNKHSYPTYPVQPTGCCRTLAN